MTSEFIHFQVLLSFQCDCCELSWATLSRISGYWASSIIFPSVLLSSPDPLLSSADFLCGLNDLKWKQMKPSHIAPTCILEAIINDSCAILVSQNDSELQCPSLQPNLRLDFPFTKQTVNSGNRWSRYCGFKRDFLINSSHVLFKGYAQNSIRHDSNYQIIKGYVTDISLKVCSFLKVRGQWHNPLRRYNRKGSPLLSTFQWNHLRSGCPANVSCFQLVSVLLAVVCLMGLCHGVTRSCDPKGNPVSENVVHAGAAKRSKDGVFCSSWKALSLASFVERELHKLSAPLVSFSGRYRDDHLSVIPQWRLRPPSHRQRVRGGA